MEAQLLLEQNKTREAALLFDSLSCQHDFGDNTSELARGTVWMLARAAGARFARGDDAGAIVELKAAIYSTNIGFTRTNYELGARLHATAASP
ncbi:MAG TPA: hypothetical protein VGQ44_02615 [Gemmatimonadaceae bacterium]|nr:hypothetical protein [Gemmatimonadaceae bacterium]